MALPAPRTGLIDITTTSVGRDTLVTAYESFFAHLSYTGSFRVITTIDPAYGVSPEELAETRRYLSALPQTHPQVSEVVIEQLPRQIGLQGALNLLFAHSSAPIGVHIEDDWEFTGLVDLDVLSEELYRHDSTQIVLTNSHVARGGTFERPGEVEEVPDSPAGLLRLTRRSWAVDYLPLCPHLHRTERWAPAVARALALTDPMRCPDERVRDRMVAEGGTDRHQVLWTPQVIARDIGREWLEQRGRYKAISPEHKLAPDAQPLPVPARGPLQLARSAALLDRAERVIPGVTQTFHKRPENFAPGAFPVYGERGSGAVLWDVDGNGYIDFVMALGAASLGYDHPAVTNVIRERAGRGTLLSLPSPVEPAAAEALVDAVPDVEMVRFLKTGAEACAAAVRLARHHTGRDVVLLAGYHGWHDQLGGASSGVPAAALRLGRRFTLNGPDDDAALLAALDQQGHEVAAVMLSTPYHRVLDASFLHAVRTACDRHGCLLVFDEIVTGFRLAPGGLSHMRGVAADLLCFSKGLAAGMPLAAVAGPRSVMADFANLRVSTTFGGETLSLEVMRKALHEYGHSDYYNRIAELGRLFRDGINAHASLLGLPDVIVGHDPMPCVDLAADPRDHATRARHLLAAMARRGFLLRRDVNFISAAHTRDHIEAAVAAAGQSLEEMVAEGTLSPGKVGWAK